MITNHDPRPESGERAGPVDGLVSCATRQGTVVVHHVTMAELATWGGLRQALAGVPDSAVLVDFGSDATVTLVFHETT